MIEPKPWSGPLEPSGVDNSGYGQPIKSTKTRRALTVAATWIAVRTKYSIGFTGARLSPGLMVKRGTAMRLEEAGNIEYVRKNSSIPVPKVHCAFTHKGCNYIVMDYVRGKTLWSWWQTASMESKESVRRELMGYMKKLRRVPISTSGRVCGLGDGPIYDYRYASNKGDGPIGGEAFGPFFDAHEFHLWLRNGFTSESFTDMENKSDHQAGMERICQIQDRRNYATKLTHGDFSSSNIIIRDNKVAGIIDWEMAGWYPDYWEFTSAWHVNVYDDFWRPEVEKILDGHEYEVELEAEKIRHRYFQSP